MFGKTQKKFFHVVLVLALMVFFTACSDGATDRSKQIISDAIKNRLKDPDSLTVKNWRFSKLLRGSVQYACVEFNAKNSFGGYGEPSLAIAKFYKGAWSLTDLNGYMSDCNARISKINKLVEMTSEGG